MDENDEGGARIREEIEEVGEGERAHVVSGGGGTAAASELARERGGGGARGSGGDGRSRRVARSLLEEDVAPFRTGNAPGSTAIGLRLLPFGARGPGTYCRDNMAHFSYWASY